MENEEWTSSSSHGLAKTEFLPCLAVATVTSPNSCMSYDAPQQPGPKAGSWKYMRMANKLLLPISNHTGNYRNQVGFIKGRIMLTSLHFFLLLGNPTLMFVSLTTPVFLLQHFLTKQNYKKHFVSVLFWSPSHLAKIPPVCLL